MGRRSVGTRNHNKTKGPILKILILRSLCMTNLIWQTVSAILDKSDKNAMLAEYYTIYSATVDSIITEPFFIAS
jgi:hypothetical protein